MGLGEILIYAPSLVTRPFLLASNLGVKQFSLLPSNFPYKYADCCAHATYVDVRAKGY